MGREFELKYAAENPSVLEDICTFLHRNVRKIPMKSTYYDTPDNALSARKWTLRLRKEGELSVVTMKTAGDGKTRGEWEYEAENLTNAAEKLVGLGAPQELSGLLQDGVRPVCGAEFLRKAVDVDLDGTLVEVALDSGRLFRGEKECPICEVEVELKSGNAEKAVEFAENLAEKFGLRVENKSKFVRAVTL